MHADERDQRRGDGDVSSSGDLAREDVRKDSRGNGPLLGCRSKNGTRHSSRSERPPIQMNTGGGVAASPYIIATTLLHTYIPTYSYRFPPNTARLQPQCTPVTALPLRRKLFEQRLLQAQLEWRLLVIRQRLATPVCLWHRQVGT